MILSKEECDREASILADILAQKGAAEAQAAFDAYVLGNEITKTGQKTLRKAFRELIGIGLDKSHPSSLEAEQALEATAAAVASSPLPTEIAIEETGTLPPDEEPEPTPADLESSYGKQALADLVKDEEAFYLALQEGIEPAVATAIYQALIRPHGTHKARPTQPKIRQSTVDSPCKFCWDLYSELEAKLQGIPPRTEATEKAIASGVATGTARTQYQEWSRAKAPEWLKKGWIK